MKKLSLIFPILLSVLVMSCSKEEDFPLVNTHSSIELDLSTIEYPYNVIEEDGKTKCYIIDIPCENTSINLKFKEINSVFLCEIKTGIYDKISNEYIWQNSVVPFALPSFEYENHFDWKFNSVFGNYDMTEEYVLKCKIPEHKNSSIQTTMLRLDYAGQRNCTVIFRQTPNL